MTKGDTTEQNAMGFNPVASDDDETVTAQLNRAYDGVDSRLELDLAALPSRVLEREDW